MAAPVMAHVAACTSTRGRGVGPGVVVTETRMEEFILGSI